MNISRLKAARLLAGMQLNDTAAIIGVTAETLRRWETGKGEPKGSQYVLLARLYDIDVLSLLPGEEEGER